MVFLYPNPYFFIGFKVDRILYEFGYEFKIFRMSEMVRIRTGVGVEADFSKSDNMCLRVVLYNEKQFIRHIYAYKTIKLNQLQCNKI